jgi:hypothetical protein
VRESGETEEFVQMAADTLAAFSGHDLPEVLRLLDQYFDGMKYSLKSLFKDEQKRIIDVILTQTLQDADASFHSVYDKHGPLLRFLKEMNQPVPEVLKATAAFVLNSDLRHTLEKDPVDAVRLAMLLELVKNEGVEIEAEGIGYAASLALTRLMRSIQQSPEKAELLERANVLVSVLKMAPLPLNLWEAQNIYYSILQTDCPRMSTRGGPAAQRWVKSFANLGEQLQVAVPAPAKPKELLMAS